MLGLRYPGAWAFGILTKVTPGIGLLWFALRREWRRLAWGLGLTAAIGGISFVVSSALWVEWFGLLADSAGETARIRVIPLPLLVRLPIAAVVIAIGAWTKRKWLVPIGVMIGLPNVWTSSTALLAAVPALWSGRRTDHGAGTTGPVAD